MSRQCHPVELRLFHAALPLRMPLRHASARVSALEELYVALTLADGSTGWCEVRTNAAYATGETDASVRRALAAVACLLGATAASELGRMVVEETGNRLAALLLEGAALDALARGRGVSVAQLLGGSGRRHWPTHGQIGHVDARSAEMLARSMAAQGFRRIKVRVGCGDLDADLARVASVRRAAGPDVQLIVDANGAWPQSDVLRAAERLAPMGILFLEQPTARDEPAMLAAVRASIAIPVFADESVRTAADVARLAELGAVDGVHLKLEKAGTVAELRRAVTIARERGLQVMVGQVDQGRLGTSLTVQAADAVGADFVEASGFYHVQQDPGAGVELVDGGVRLADGPGLGVAVDMRLLQEVGACATT